MSIEVCYAKQLKSLADQLIERLKKSWKNPFESPAIVFPDAKLEQWFKQYYLTKEKAVANLNCLRIDRLIMNYLRDCYLKIPGNENKKVEELTPEIFAHAIIAFLKKNNYENLNQEKFKSIKKYVLKNKKENTLEKENALEVEERKLYDFSIRMAALFLEYERSRPPKGYLYGLQENEGLLEIWGKENSLFFGESSKETEEWQHQLYADVLQKKSPFECSFLDKAYAEYQKTLTDKDKEISYLTLPYLYNEVKRNNVFSKSNLANISQNVFVFGLAGMGQYYYIVLKQLSASRKIYAYVPNPCMEFWEDMESIKKWSQEHSEFANSTEAESEDLKYLQNLTKKSEENIYENTLLQKWGFYGRDTVRLWNLIADDSYFADEFLDIQNEQKNFNLLQSVQYLISKRLNHLPNDEFSDSESATLFDRNFENDKSLVLRSAPSTIREIEDLHTRICELIKNDVSLRDILVVSPDIQEYATAIHKIFNMSSRRTDKNVRIPYCIIDPDSEKSFVTKIFELLFIIAKKQDFNRSDFFELINNSVIQHNRNIASADVQSFKKWTSRMGVFRNGTGESFARKDWEKALKRLLLATISDEVQIDNTLESENVFSENKVFEIIPYEDMDSANAKTLFKFVEIIDDLNSWINFTKQPYKKTSYETEYFDAVKEYLKKWAFMANPSEDLLGEKLVYASAISALNALKFEFFAGLDNVSFDIIGQTVMSNAQKTLYSRGEIFVNSLTFMNFKPNRILPAKYIFFIGAGSKKFPGENGEDSLDLRKKQFWLGDATTISKNRYGFLSLLMNAENGFYISFINKDLKKDEDFYVSSVVEDLKSFIQNATSKKCKLDEQKISLDEIRPWNELYTSRALRNKEFYENLTKNDDEKTNLESQFKSEPPKRVKLSQLKKFLEDPCKFQIENRLCSEEKNEENETLEPIDYDHLESAIALKDIFKNVDCNQDEAVKKVYEKLLNQKTLPSGIFGERVAERICESVKKIQQKVQWEFVFEEKCLVDFKTWVLEDNYAWHTKEGKEDLIFFDITSSKDIKKAKFLSIYVSALAYLANQKNKETQTIKLLVFSVKDEKPKEHSITMNSENAKKILCDIYQQAFVDCYKIAVPFNIWAGNIKKNNKPGKSEEWNWKEYQKKVYGDHGEWKYFEKNKLFKFENICGFSGEEAFEEEWNTAVEKMSEMIQFDELKKGEV